jgi:cytochrome c
VRRSVRGIVEGNAINRNFMLGNFRIGSFVTMGFAALALAVAVFAQDPAAKKSAPSAGAKPSPAAVARGKEVFDKKCAVCHYADSDAKKIGPGLKDISKRGTFTVNNNKVTEESLKTWIENGDSLMPPFKDVLEAPQIKDVIAYVRTL